MAQRKGAGRRRILITGAGGYVGGRLRAALEAQGRPVRCLVRGPGGLADPGEEGTEVYRGDLLQKETLAPALKGVHTAYYLVHSMGSRDDFEELDRIGARNFAEMARKAGISRIIYLGGLCPRGAGLSAHLRSRREVGDLLRASGIPVIEFRSSIVLGAGSLSFEMVRALVDRLPVMVTPRWANVTAQPIGIRDLLEYLLAALDLPPGPSRIFEVGGSDRVSYKGIMQEYARQRGLRRVMIPVPVLTPRLSGLWLGLVTPLYARVGRALIESIRHPTVVEDDEALRVFDVRPRGIRHAIADALEEERKELFEDLSRGEPSLVGCRKRGGFLFDARESAVPVPPAKVFSSIRRIGGRQGYYYGDLLWRLRGLIDSAVGGVGMRIRRNGSTPPRVGDALDFWRVIAAVPDHRLSLRAEMRLPGRAWLDFRVEAETGGARFRQTAIFEPRGLLGTAYWHLLRPIHDRVFRGMLDGILREARR